MKKTAREKALEQDIYLARHQLIACLEQHEIIAARSAEGVDFSLPMRLLRKDLETSLALLDWHPSKSDGVTYQD